MVKLQKVWESLNSSFWFVPTLMTLIAVGFSFFTVWLDEVLSNEVAALFGYVRGPEGARSLLSTVAGSIITVGGVVFSITIAALTLASSQFGPRLLRNFIRDKGNQFVLGTFISTFMYCLLVLRTINGSQENTFVPHISVTLGVLLAAASMGVFIYFIHHVSSLIQAENVIGRVTGDLHRTIDRLFPEMLGQNLDEVEDGNDPMKPKIAQSFIENSRHPDNNNSNNNSNSIQEALSARFPNSGKPIKAPKEGYLQAIDTDKLLDLAKDRNLVLEVSQAPGQFLFEGMELMRAWPADKVDVKFEAQIQNTFIFGPSRTTFQDVDFAFDQLAEIALRALSPGINDPFTAISCIDSLGAGLAQLGKRSLPSPYRYDEQEQLRVVVKVATKKDLVARAFDQIREAANTNTAVTLHLLKTIGHLGKFIGEGELRTALREQAGLIKKGSSAKLPDEAGRRRVDELYQAVILDL